MIELEHNIWRVTKTCSNCPFNDEGKSLNLSAERMARIREGLDAGGSFNCHKTEYPEVFNTKPIGNRMCAGAYNYLKAKGKPNMIMQVAERMGVDGN